jgi:nucleoside-diphosphate-sugar epimerase
MKALVTGATGFIGSHLCESLAKGGYSVTCLVKKTSNLKWIEDLDVKFITGDCTHFESLLNSIKEYDYVFHLAGLTKSCSEEDFYRINTKGTENILNAICKKNLKLKRFIYLSSLSAVGPSRNGNPVIEDTQPSPVSNYGKSKLEGEKIVLNYSKTVPITILRPPAIYGPRDKDLLVFFKMIRKGFFPNWGKCYYSLLYVDDLIQGIVVASENRKAEGKVFFLSDSKFYTGNEIVTEISSTLNVKPTQLKVPKFIMPFFALIGERINKHGIINRDKIRELSHSHWTCNAKKAREELGYTTKVNLREGIKWTADWYRIHRWL